MTTQEKQNQYIMGTYGRFPVVLEQGKQESCRMKPESSISTSEAVSERILWATVTKHG